MMSCSLLYTWGIPAFGCDKCLKKDLTVREHLKTIQSDGDPARWAKLTPEEECTAIRNRHFRSSECGGKEHLD